MIAEFSFKKQPKGTFNDNSFLQKVGIQAIRHIHTNFHSHCMCDKEEKGGDEFAPCPPG